MPIFRLATPLALAWALTSIASYAASEAVEKLAYWETRGNALALRNAEQIALEHYEIPLELVGTDFARALPEPVRASLIFEKNGKQYVRWIKNPEDTKWHKELETYLKSKGADTKLYKYFTAHYTASRSMLVQDPVSKTEFSAKVSTNRTGGNWTDKKQDVNDAKQIRLVDDYVRGIQDRIGGFEHFVVMDEPATLGIKDIDQGMVIRMLGDLPEGKHYYLPGFTAVHEKIGREIALKNGSKDPASFWNENYNKPLARAMAELNAYTGLSYSSPHSQNFLIELDKEMKPTGRIVFRDLGDSNIHQKFVRSTGRPDIVDAWDRTHHKSTIHAKVGILKGNESPSWLPDKIYEKTWAQSFYDEYEKTVAAMAGVPKAELEKIRFELSDEDYFRKRYETKGERWKRYFAIAQCLDSRRPLKLKTKERCSDILAAAKRGARALSPSAVAEAASSAQKIHGERTAAQAWNDLQESTLTRKPLPIGVSDTPRVVSYGGEKEGSSSLITRVLGPKREQFARYTASLPADQRELFLRDFLGGWVEGRYRAQGVRDVNGMLIEPKLEGLQGVDFKTLTAKELDEKFALWLENHGDRALSFVRGPDRRRLFRGEFPGQTGRKGLEYFEKAGTIGPGHGRGYKDWVPLYGPAEKYLDAAHKTSVGWEMNFKPQATYAEFEEMMDWFRDAMGTNGERFQALGHQWMVYPKRPDVTPEKALAMDKRLRELYKNIQAYIVLKGIQGRSNIEFSAHKSVQTDMDLADELHSTYRGVIRLENRYKADGMDALNIELRAGTKSDNTRRFVQQVLSARYAAAEFDDLAAIDSWTLVSGETPTADELAKRFNVSRLEAQRAIAVLSGARMPKRSEQRMMNSAYWVPFWNWEKAPYVSAPKQEHLKALTRTFIKSLASWKSTNLQEVQDAMATWIAASNLSADIENYLKPKFGTGRAAAELHQYRPARTAAAAIDVNQIDLGIEYTGRFPIKYRAQFSEPVIKDKRAWLKTQFDYTMDERRAFLRKVAEDIGRELNGGKAVKPVDLTDGGHGHSLVIAYEVPDAKGRNWRIEWDGVGRDYDAFGEVLEESARGGHVEVVTPKFNPTHDEMAAVFRGFEKNSMVPSMRAGGGHVNIDLAPFKGKPRAMARFIAQFLENRGTLAMMFQHIGRLKSAEPLEVSPALIQRLRDFNGTEEELKQLLYNERFFNTRLGRKTRYSQLDVSSYFQDVVPEEFITRDFDLKNDVWRKTFNFNPKIRKMEFRLFNAPRDLTESQLQIKIVRAMLDRALNDSTPLTGYVQKVDYKAMVDNPEAALKEFEKLMADLKLDPQEYKGYFLDGMTATREAITSKFYQPLEAKLAEHPKQEGWGTAVAERPPSQALLAESRVWSGAGTAPEATQAMAERQLVREKAQELREGLRKGEVLKTLDRSHDAQELSRYLSKAEIRDLPTQDALLAIYQRKGADASEIQELVTELKLRDDFKDSVTKAMQEGQSRSTHGFGQWLIQHAQPGGLSDEALGFAVQSEDGALRKAAYDHLAGLTDQDFIKVVDNMLYDSSPLVRRDFLAAMNSRRWTPLPPADESALIRTLRNSVFEMDNVSLEARLAATKALSKMKTAEADGLLLHIIDSPTAPVAQKKAALAAHGHRVTQSQARFIAALMNDPDPKIATLAKRGYRSLLERAAALPQEELAKLPEIDRLFGTFAKLELRKQPKASLTVAAAIPERIRVKALHDFENSPGAQKYRRWVAQQLFSTMSNKVPPKGFEQVLADLDPVIADGAIQTLQRFENPMARQVALLEAISKTVDEPSLSRVLTALKAEKLERAQVREFRETATALRQLLDRLPGAKSAATRDLIVPLLPVLTDALQEKNGMQRLGALINRTLAKVQDPVSRRVLAQLLSGQIDELALVAFHATLADGDATVREAARRSLKATEERLLSADFDVTKKLEPGDALALKYRFSGNARIQQALAPAIATITDDLPKLLGQHSELLEAYHPAGRKDFFQWVLKEHPDKLLTTDTKALVGMLHLDDPAVTKAIQKLLRESPKGGEYGTMLYRATTELSGKTTEDPRPLVRWLEFLETEDWSRLTPEGREMVEKALNPIYLPHESARPMADRLRAAISRVNLGGAGCATEGVQTILGAGGP